MSCLKSQPLTPWDYLRFVSWWAMEKFSAETFFNIGRFLKAVERNFDDETKGQGRSRDTQIEKGSLAKATTAMLEIKKHCKNIGLKVSVKCVDSLMGLLAAEEKTTLGN